jgi:hypothetical protein
MNASTHPLRCQCGAVQGTIANPRSSNHAVCYCRDCQAFAHYLGKPNEILDARGGSDIVQTQPKNLTFTQGLEQLACIRLTPKGLLRWYSRCCRTPIGNTLATPKLSFIGLLHSCLAEDTASVERSFGPVMAWVNTASARGEPAPRTEGLGRSVWWFLRTALRARVTGDYRQNPLFHRNTGAAVVLPYTLSAEEHTRVMQAASSARL